MIPESQIKEWEEAVKHCAIVSFDTEDIRALIDEVRRFQKAEEFSKKNGLLRAIVDQEAEIAQLRAATQGLQPLMDEIMRLKKENECLRDAVQYAHNCIIGTVRDYRDELLKLRGAIGLL